LTGSVVGGGVDGGEMVTGGGVDTGALVAGGGAGTGELVVGGVVGVDVGGTVTTISCLVVLVSPAPVLPAGLLGVLVVGSRDSGVLGEMRTVSLLG
jgi:hypothetical protein